MTYNPKAVANAFLELAEAQNKSIDPLKMQKLVYLAHGWHMAITGKPLIDEYAEAWQYGPVIPSLYHALKSYGARPISRPTEVYNFDKECHQIPMVNKDSFAQKLIEKVWDSYGKFNGLQLSNITHQANTPWYETREQSGGTRNADIPNSLIAEHFAKLARHNKAAQHERSEFR